MPLTQTQPVAINRAALAALRRYSRIIHGATLRFAETPQASPDPDIVFIDLSPEVERLLREAALTGESFSETIIRMCTRAINRRAEGAA